MQIPENILVLIEKYLANKATEQEKLDLHEWYRSFNDTESEITANDDETELVLGDRIRNRLLDTIHSDQGAVVMKPRRKWYIPAAAAAALILLSAATYFMFFPGSAGKQIVTTTSIPPLINDVSPGGNKAMLTLADGSTIVLDSAANGTITRQGNISIQKLTNGLLKYISNEQPIEKSKTIYNTISTPRGGQYQATLSDGTKVWLNAASSIRFPVAFSGAERKVEITGEAYFEVTKNKEMPFRVIAAASEIEVLGTHFNVNAYRDESFIKTTLLEGLVRLTSPAVSGNKPAAFLQPGQQAAINKEGKIKIFPNADLEEAMAWKNGLFHFKSADMETILRQISRWYDVDIEYHGKANLHFTGQLTRNGNVSKVFEAIALTNEIRFKIDGKKIIVSL